MVTKSTSASTLLSAFVFKPANLWQALQAQLQSLTPSAYKLNLTVFLCPETPMDSLGDICSKLPLNCVLAGPVASHQGAFFLCSTRVRSSLRQSWLNPLSARPLPSSISANPPAVGRQRRSWSSSHVTWRSRRRRTAGGHL